jgi:hypothetical protein
MAACVHVVLQLLQIETNFQQIQVQQLSVNKPLISASMLSVAECDFIVFVKSLDQWKAFCFAFKNPQNIFGQNSKLIYCIHFNIVDQSLNTD